MIYDLENNDITSGEDIQAFFHTTSPTDIAGIVSALVDHILNRDFESYWQDFSYPVRGGNVDPGPYFFHEYLNYIKQERSLQNMLSPDNNDAEASASYLELITGLL